MLLEIANKPACTHVVILCIFFNVNILVVMLVEIECSSINIFCNLTTAYLSCGWLMSVNHNKNFS